VNLVVHQVQSLFGIGVVQAVEGLGGLKNFQVVKTPRLQLGIKFIGRSTGGFPIFDAKP
jgi:hypothetical protein